LVSAGEVGLYSDWVWKKDNILELAQLANFLNNQDVHHSP